jgi:hypothetical protein
MKNFKFDKDNHYYTLDDKRLYGVTKVLGVIAKPSLIQWAADETVKYIRDNCGKQSYNGKLTEFYASVTDKLLDEAKVAHRKKKESAGDVGHDVHADIEDMIKNAIHHTDGFIGGTSTHPMINKFIKWAEKNHIRFLESELMMYSETMWVAGTMDLLFEKEGKVYIGDIKTTSGIYDRTPFFQCAGYSLMLEETKGLKPEGYCIIRLGKDGSFEDKWSYDIEGDKQGFLAALTLFKSLENYAK